MVRKPLKEIDGYVLSLSKYKEDSAIVTFASREGIVSLLANHIYKPKSPLKPLSLAFNFVQVNYQESASSLLFASQALVLEDISPCYLSYEKNLFLTFLEELSLLFYKEGNNYPIDEIQILLKALEEGKDILSLSLLLLGIFYRDLGLSENVDSCILCQREDNLTAFDLSLGGFVCEEDRIREGLEPREKIELFILKYAFMPVDEKNCSRVVPKGPGRVVFLELLDHLLHYFDISQAKTLSLFLSIL